MPHPYFVSFEDRVAPRFPAFTNTREVVWHVLAGAAAGAGAQYLYWRWTASMNPDAPLFSILVATAETLFFLGTLLFYFDIWKEGDTPRRTVPATRADAGLTGDGGEISVDVFITTFDEDVDVVRPSILDAQQIEVPANVRVNLYLLDDGHRPEFASMAQATGIHYIARDTNEGFKAGNLRNALFQTDGDFVAICDADTRLFPTFLTHTLGYFRDPKVAWVQTPHWFYDVPQGRTWENVLRPRLGRAAGMVGASLAWVTGRTRVGADPFLADPVLFFDVIQRRRNRHGASFCCGAGSIHRREAVFDAALKRKAADLQRAGRRFKQTLPPRSVALQPFRFHVSEDIYTSMQLHGDPEAQWRSVYHPQIEARMLSPWSLDAWAVQKLKYAGGTLDIMLHDNPLFLNGMSFVTKLHYAATFWSYLSAVWAPIMLLAPVYSMLSGQAPVEAYSATFFTYFLPMILLSEAAMVAGCKGYNVQSGRVQAIATLHIQLRALAAVLRRKKPRFPATPKTPVLGGGRHHAVPALGLITVMILAAAFGVWQYLSDVETHSAPFLIVNVFWLAWNAMTLLRGYAGALQFRPDLVTPQPRKAIAHVKPKTAFQ